MKAGLENAAARAAGLSVLLSAVLMVVKIVVGLTQDSVAVLSDGLDSGQDLFAAALVLVSIQIGSRPADPGHPYGHGRAETVAATLQAILIGGAGLYVLARAVTRLLDPPPAIGTEISLATMAMSLASNLALVQYTSRVARSTGSPALEAEARHLRTNVAQAAAIIIGLVLVEATGEVGFDPLVAIGLAAYLTWTAGRILWAALQDVLDTSLPAREVQQVRDAILAEGGAVVTYHRLRTRRSGQERHIDLHLVLQAQLTLAEADAIRRRLEERLLALWPRAVVTIQVEPADTASPTTGNARKHSPDGR